MPRSITIAQVIDKNKIASDRVWVYALKVYVTDANGDVLEELNIANNDESLTIAGDTYEPVPFQLEKSETATDLTSLTVAIQDQTRMLQTRLQLYQGAVGFKVDVMIVAVDEGATTGSLEPDLVEQYIIMATQANDYVVTFHLGAENPLRYKVPTRSQWKDRCSFRYKSLECGYAGGLTSCDFTLSGPNGCEAHDNEERFGGYPGLVIR